MPWREHIPIEAELSVHSRIGHLTPKSASRDWVLPLHYSDNKLRDSDNYFSDEGHTFDYNRDKIISYDVCGACESHAIMMSLPANTLLSAGGISSKADALKLMMKAKLLKDLQSQEVDGNPHFKHCPVGLTL